MTCIAQLLAQLSPNIEAQLRPNLSGFRGLFVKGYLPQTWVFCAGTEYASLIVDQSGGVTAYTGSADQPDVLITTTHATLSGALEAANGLRSRDSVPRGPVQPTFYTSKGRTAFNYLRGRLGL